MIDLHSHILPGIDDGARTIDDSLELARRAVAEGVTAIAATPHVRDDWPTTADAMEAGVAAVRDALEAAAIDLEILHGGEIALDRLRELSGEELVRFSYAQTGRYLLVEVPFLGWPLGFESTLLELLDAEITPVLAHPERNNDVRRDDSLVDAAVEAGAIVQVTAASLDGRLGPTTKATTERLVDRGVVHMIASDAHTPEIREFGLAAAAAAVKDPGLARYLTEEAPAAVAAGEDVPDPRPRKRSPWRFRR